MAADIAIVDTMIGFPSPQHEGDDVGHSTSTPAALPPRDWSDA